jgi:hypothetical protein
MVFGIQLRYPLPRFSRLGGPGLRTGSRLNDFELYRPARRAGLDPLTTPQEGVAVYSERLFYIAVAGSSPREGLNSSPPTAPTDHSQLRQTDRRRLRPPSRPRHF